MAHDSGLLPTLLERLDADPKARPFEAYVLAALEGPDALAKLLDSAEPPARPSGADAAVREPRGAYLKSITVEGFRGVGARKTLELPPGPGLTLVVGRNGSGKSSFAEALELLLTGDTHRWQGRSKVWREGWRNLHHATAAIQAEFHVDGEKGGTVVATRWKDGAELDGGDTFAQIQGRPRMDLLELGWAGPLQTYRPFLSYSELGSMLDEGPSKLFDALAAILGLEELTRAQATLADARKPREKAKEEADATREELLEGLRALDDDRARSAVAALEADDLDALEAVVARTDSTADGALPLLRQLASLPAPANVTAVVQDLRDAAARVKAAAGTMASRSSDLADVLDRALHFHEAYGDGPCPVCGRDGALDATWHARQAREVKALRDSARATGEARAAADRARQKARTLAVPPADVLGRAAEVGLDASVAIAALEAWRTALAHEDGEALADGIEAHAAPLASAVASVREAASSELQRREDRWKPTAFALIAWLPAARAAAKGAPAVKQLEQARVWLRKATDAIRDARFQPIKERAQHVWSLLRMQSNVSLEDIRFEGAANRRTVALEVKVDGVEAEALGVISQGEQNALALSLFIPRATLPESPFRFVVIDDPVQSMDPRRVDGLAKALQETAAARQVVVFTHDDRLPEAVRRLQIPATVIEVTRREGSAVELRPGEDPIARYMKDARAVALTDGLPAQAARRVVPGLCRMAVEAACAEAIRRRRLGRGESHASIEDLLGGLHGTTAWAATALFDAPDRGSDVLGQLNRNDREYADTFRLLNSGAHEGLPGAAIDVVRSSERLAGWLRTRA